MSICDNLVAKFAFLCNSVQFCCFTSFPCKSLYILASVVFVVDAGRVRQVFDEVSVTTLIQRHQCWFLGEVVWCGGRHLCLLLHFQFKVVNALCLIQCFVFRVPFPKTKLKTRLFGGVFSCKTPLCVVHIRAGPRGTHNFIFEGSGLYFVNKYSFHFFTTDSKSELFPTPLVTIFVPFHVRWVIACWWRLSAVFFGGGVVFETRRIWSERGHIYRLILFGDRLKRNASIIQNGRRSILDLSSHACLINLLVLLLWRRAFIVIKTWKRPFLAFTIHF